jgi:hypothetical protein
MPYRVIVTLRNGRDVRDLGIFLGPTPKRGDVIELQCEGKPISAHVTIANRAPAKIAGTTAACIDDASVEEI